MVKRIFYAAAGPGDMIGVHEHWRRGEPWPGEVSITFSEMIEDFCVRAGAEAYLMSPHSRAGKIQDGQFTIEHRPGLARTGAGWRYHVGVYRRAQELLRTAREFGADTVILDSGVTHYFMMESFSRAGMKVVVVLHNAIWSEGHRPSDPLRRVIQALDGRFFRRVPTAVIGVSPACRRQVEELAGGHPRPVFETRAQFRRGRFEQIPPPPDPRSRPFRILFVGRAIRVKGIFDILEMARAIEDRLPGQAKWDLCGSGADFEELQARHAELNLDGIVTLHGWTSPEAQLPLYAACHACIVPTRTGMLEGLAMTAAEAILAGRPLITCAMVPALELLRPACVEARTDDVSSYVEQITNLMNDPALYERLAHACGELQAPFYDRSQGLDAVLERALGTQPAAATSGQA